MMFKWKIMIIMTILIVLIKTPISVFAMNIDDMITQNLNVLDLKPVESLIDKTGQSTTIDFNELILKAIKGELNLSPTSILNEFSKLVFNEIYENNSLMRNLLVIAFLSAFMKNLTESFENKGVGELGFFVSYIMLVIVVFSSFNVAVSIAQTIISDLAGLMEASVPLFISLIVMSGQVASAYAFHPVIIFAINIVSFFIKDFLLPLIVLTAAIHIINYLSEREILDKFSELMKSFCGWTLKGICFLFISILAIQRISVPILNNVALKTAKSSMGAIPIVGDALTGTMDTVMYFMSATKSGVLIAMLILIITICSVPIVKLLILFVIYKFMAAVIQPICDSRIVSCMDSIAGFVILLVSCVVMVTVMFIVSVVIIMSY